MEREKAWKETVKKSEITAKSIYDYKKLEYPRESFLDCEIEEQKEELDLYFDISNKKVLTKIKDENKLMRLSVLHNIAKLEKLSDSYKFQLSPENLYYDINGQVSVKLRDVYEAGETYQKDVFLAQYKALAGFALQRKYQYKDYLNGGMQLLKKDKLLAALLPLDTVSDLADTFEALYEKIQTDKKRTRTEVHKGMYRMVKLSLVIFILMSIGTGSLAAVQSFRIIPKNTAFIEAGNAYIESDYVKIIDALAGYPVSELDVHQKYILAVAYVKSENLNVNQKDHILANLSLQGNEKIIDYWIYLGRFEVAEAQNIAMQQFDDELLLYAYLKEKYLVEIDPLISGEEKSTQLSALESKIQPLTEKYSDEE